MYQIDNSTVATTQPASTTPGTPGFFTDGNAGTGLSPTVVPAEFLNVMMLELINIVTGAGMTLSKSSFNQAFQAIRRLSQKSVVLTDAGAVNAYAAVNSPALASGDLVSGLVQRVSIATLNTGASTYAPDGLASKPIYGMALVALQGGELPAKGIATLMYLVASNVNSGNGAWILLECIGGSLSVANATASQHAPTAGQVASGSLGTATAGGTANAITAVFPASPTAYATGQPFTIISTTANTGAMTAILTLGGTAQASVPIIKGNNQALAAGDFPAGYPGEFNYSPSFGVLVMQNPATGVTGNSGGSYSSNPAPVTVATVFTSASTGAAIESNSSSALGHTLPAANTFPAGKAISFSNINTGIATFNRAGADTITGGNLSAATALPLNGGECVTLVSNGTNAWYVAASNVTYFGAPQTRQNLLASRFVSTTYTNSTGRPIDIHVSIVSSAGAGSTMTIGGLVANMSWPSGVSGWAVLSGKVLPGESYLLNPTGVASINEWTEIR